MHACPKCGFKGDESVEIEAEVVGGDDELTAKDEILAELMEQLGGTLEGKLKRKKPPGTDDVLQD